jgi:electron transfer flavoprotein alpha subunit
LPENISFVGKKRLQKQVKSLEDADIVVAGGRGVGSKEGFEKIFALAEALGGAVGASRSAVDEGWVDYSHQVGQTGKTVSPSLYIAFGISGSLQHRAGMQTSKTIVGVNIDPDAPIFSICDVKVVEDLHAIIPHLLKAFRDEK